MVELPPIHHHVVTLIYEVLILLLGESECEGIIRYWARQQLPVQGQCAPEAHAALVATLSARISVYFKFGSEQSLRSPKTATIYPQSLLVNSSSK